MTDDLYSRRQVSQQHLEVLAQYMERYPPLALASARSREGVVQSKRMWEKIARTLNRIDENVTKSGKSWARYWIDLKFKLRRKYAILQKCNSEGTHCSVSLSPWEERMAKVLTDEEGNLLPTSSVYHRIKNANLHYPLKRETTKLIRPNKTDDADGDEMDTDQSDDYLVSSSPITEQILLPDQSDVKPTINGKHLRDPIQIEEKKSLEDLKRELLEFELRKQKELFEIEKQYKKEKHDMEMSMLRLKKQLMLKEFKNS